MIGTNGFHQQSWILCPRFLTFPKLSMISHAQLWLLLFLQISLFIYFNLGHGPIRAKNNVNKQTNLKNNNNQSWAWLIMLNFGNVKNLGHKSQQFPIHNLVKSQLKSAIYCLRSLSWYQNWEKNGWLEQILRINVEIPDIAKIYFQLTYSIANLV